MPYQQDALLNSEPISKRTGEWISEIKFVRLKQGSQLERELDVSATISRLFQVVWLAKWVPKNILGYELEC